MKALRYERRVSHQTDENNVTIDIVSNNTELIQAYPSELFERVM